MYVAFTCIKTGRQLQESAFHVKQDSNAFNLFAVAIRKSANIIGHVPWKISAACSLLYREEPL